MVPTLSFLFMLFFKCVNLEELAKNNFIGMPVGTRIGCLPLVLGLGDLEDDFKEFALACPLKSTSDEFVTVASAEEDDMMAPTNAMQRKG